MKRKSIKQLLFTAVIMLLSFSHSSAQSGQPRQSPLMTATGKIANSKIMITYGSPSVRGRKIWGELVPYGKVWRAGANEATMFETEKELIIDGKKLPAGKYSLYAIPGETEWQIILNSQTGQWGITESGETTRDPAKDVMVVSIKPKKSASSSESLIYTISKKGFALNWAGTEVMVPAS